MNSTWAIAVAVTLAAHGALATWFVAREPAPRVAAARKVTRFRVLPPAPKKLVEAPVPPEPPPPPPPPPKLVKRARPKAQLQEPPPESGPTKTDIVPAESGLTSDQSAPQGGLAVQQGGGIDGAVQTGSGKTHEPAPPAPPVPAPPKPARKFVPIFEVSRMPKAIHAVQPEVPDGFSESNREAVVVVEVAIGADGVVLDARAVKKAGFGLDEAAVSAAKKTRFEPALVGDRPVAVKMQIPYRFKVRG